MADRESRAGSDSSDWMLDRAIFSRLAGIWPMDIDLFAAPWNAQLESFVSWKPQPGAVASNAFSVNWRSFSGYAFLPFSPVFKCIQKIRREKASVVLIYPVWTGQPWFPLLLEHSCDVPRLLEQSRTSLTSPIGEAHPLLATGALQLAAWKLSGDPSSCKDFRNRWSNYSWAHVARPQTRPTNLHGGLGTIGVWEGVRIPFRMI